MIQLSLKRIGEMISLYKIIFVDDEIFVIDNIINSIDWSKYNFEVTGIFAAASEALKFIENNYVDGIFTDIKMPNMNGIELAAEIHRNHPGTVVFFLSAYDDLEYAKAALPLGVRDYIIKPVSFSSLDKACSHMKECIEEQYSTAPVFLNENPRTVSLQQIYSKLRDNDNVSSEQFTVAILSYLGVEKFTALKCIPITIKIHEIEHFLRKWHHGIHGLHTAITNLLFYDNLVLIPTIFLFNKIEIFAVYSADLKKNSTESLEQFRKKFIASCKDLLGLNVSVTFNGVPVPLDEYINKNTHHYCEKFTDLMHTVNNGFADEFVSMLIDILENANENKSFLKDFSIYFSNSDNYDIQDIINSNSDLFKSPARAIENFMQVYIIGYKLAVNNLKKKKRLDSVDLAKLYIYEHFREKIKRQDILLFAHSNKTTLAKLFKAKTGLSLMEYVSRFRINHARILLISDTDMNINEIGYFVGFESIRNFFPQFSGITGLTPSKYKSNFSSVGTQSQET